MEENTEGFLYPQINRELCKQCGHCETVCPSVNNMQNPYNISQKPDAYAAVHCDEKIREKSSSGGLFSALSAMILWDGGIVFGAAIENDLSLLHIGINKVEDLWKLRGSKYYQSSINYAYQQVKRELLSDRKVLFSGTPCQIAGLYGFLGKKKSNPNLITVDVICHGVPSPKVFRKYIEECESDRRGKVTQVFFRDKISGWKSYSMTTVMEYDSQKTVFDDRNQRCSMTLHQDPFLRVFLQDICLRPSCHECIYARFPRVADITLADYWGVAYVHPEMDDDRGTSLVLLNSQKGRLLWDNIQDTVKAVSTDLDEAVQYNPSAYSSHAPHKDRDVFFNELDAEPLSILIGRYCKKGPFFKRIFRKLKKHLG
nr:Coenzyme F420 hydrogenase/dehydrogenase, beta subunit C-terminal domain [uncultured Desulfobacter sp.]